MEQIIEMLAHIEMCVTGMTICTVIIMVMAILTAVNSFFLISKIVKGVYF